MLKAFIPFARQQLRKACGYAMLNLIDPAKKLRFGKAFSLNHVTISACNG